MNRYLIVSKGIWKDSRSRDRLGARITTRHGKGMFIDRHEIRAVCDDLHDVADQLDLQIKEINNQGEK